MRFAHFLWSLAALAVAAEGKGTPFDRRPFVVSSSAGPTHARNQDVAKKSLSARGGSEYYNKAAEEEKTPFLLSPVLYLRFLGLGAISFGVPGYFFPEFIHNIIGQGVITSYAQLYQTGWAWRESMMGILAILAANTGNKDMISGGTKAMTAAAFFGLMQDVFGEGWNPSLGYLLAIFHGGALLWGLILVYRDATSKKN